MDLYNSQYWTSEHLANFMVSKIDHLSDSLDLSILDPAAGNGALLEACSRAGYHRLYGIELDGDLACSVGQVERGDALLDIFFEGKKFDVVIMNPPYIQLQKMNKKYKDQNFFSYSGLGDIYQLFMERALDWIHEDGLVIALVSNKWLRSGYGKSSRNYLKNNAFVLEIIDLGPSWFEGATVDICIVCYKHGVTGDTIPFYEVSYDSN